MQKNKFFIFSVTLVMFLAITFSGCGENNDSSSDGTTVTLIMKDETGTINPEDEYIMSIYDEADPDDFRYSQYSTKRNVTFTNVEPDDYVAHFGSNYEIGKTGVRLTVEEGDNITVTFTKYTSAQIWIPVGITGNGFYQPYNQWKNEVVYQ